jgi:hypothetical protein
MDARIKDKDGLTVCPQCGRHYTPVLEVFCAAREKQGMVVNRNRPIQELFPNATPMQREQLITGLCSDECWDAYLGIAPRRGMSPEEAEADREVDIKAINKEYGNGSG